MFARKITPEIKGCILQNKDMQIKALTALVNRTFDINICTATVGRHLGRHKKKKQRKPSFLLKPLGTERIDKDGYVRVITESGEKLKHRLVWESENPPVKPDEIIIFIDGDKTNICLDNMVLIKRKYIGAINEFFGGIANVKPQLRKTALLSIETYVEARERALKAKKIKPKKDVWQDIVRLHLAGETKNSIAKHTGRSTTTVAWTIRRFRLGAYGELPC